MFLRKKKFKVIQFSKFGYIKTLIIPIIATLFYIHSLIMSNSHLSFMKAAMPYSYLQSEYSILFYNGISQILQERIKQSDEVSVVANNLNRDFLLLYRDYFSTHY